MILRPTWQAGLQQESDNDSARKRLAREPVKAGSTVVVMEPSNKAQRVLAGNTGTTFLKAQVSCVYNNKKKTCSGLTEGSLWIPIAGRTELSLHVKDTRASHS